MVCLYSWVAYEVAVALFILLQLIIQCLGQLIHSNCKEIWIYDLKFKENNWGSVL